MSNDANFGVTLQQCCPVCCSCFLCVLVVGVVVAALSNPALTCFATMSILVGNTSTEIGGTAIALTCAGEQAVVGVGMGDGLVEVARLDFATNAYNQSQMLLPPLANASGAFGATVATDCTSGMLAVSEPLFGSGRVHLFERTSTDITDGSALYEPTTVLTEPNVTVFGASLAFACHRRVLAVTAYDGDAGRVYVYETVNATWVLMEIIEQPSNVSGAADFGAAVAVSCDALVLAVGAPLDGAVVIYQRTDTESPFALSVMVRDEHNYTHFGSTVALAHRGHIITVGAPLHDTFNGSLNDAGAIYQYELTRSPPAPPSPTPSPPAPTLTSRLASPLEGVVENARFGTSLATNWDASFLVVGSASPSTPGMAMRFHYEEDAYILNDDAFSNIVDASLLGNDVASSFGGREFASTSTGNSSRVGVIDCSQRHGSVCPVC